MPEIDTLLDALARAPAPARLARLDADVLARLDRPQANAKSRLGLTALLVAAGAIGLIGGGLAPRPATAQPPLDPFGLVAALTPATLLVGVESR